MATFGVTLSAGTGALLKRAERQTAHQVMDRRVESMRLAVRSETRRYVEALDTAAAGLSTQPELTADGFVTATASLRRMKLAGASGLVFVAPVAHTEIDQAQARWRAAGAGDLRLRPVGTGEHLFSVFVRRMNASTPLPTGIDVVQSEPATETLRQARTSSTVALSKPYHLLTDRQVPAAQRQLSFALAAPVYAPTVAGARGPFRGWLVLGLRSQDFLGETMHHAAQGLVRTTLLARADGRWQRLATDDPRTTGDPRSTGGELHRRTEVSVAGRTWSLRMSADQAALPGGDTHLDDSLLIAGLVLTAALSALVLTLTTGQRRAERRVRVATAGLRETEAQLRLLLDGARDHAIVMLDTEGRVTSWSDNAERIKGHTEAEILGQPYAMFFPPEAVAAGEPERILTEARSAGRVEVQGERVRRDGTRFWADVVMTAVTDAAGRPRGFVKVTQDTTARRRAEQTLRRQAEQLARSNAELQELDRLKSQFVATVSHELRTPLSSICGYTELLIDGIVGDLSEKERRIVGIIERNGQRLLAMIEDLLTFARVEAGATGLTLETVRVNDLAARVCGELRPLAATNAVTVELHPDPAAPALVADAGHLERVLTNLVGNAIKFSPDGGTVTLTTGHDDAGVTVTVADTGIGIAVEEQDKLFQQFYRASGAQTREIAGSGLGLAIAKALVEAHGGTIDLVSALGVGTTVTVRLPHSADPRRETA